MRIIVPIIVGLCVMFFGTRGGTESVAQSTTVTNWFQMLGFFRNINFSLAQFIVRKMAHMSEYGLFALTTDWSLAKYDAEKAKYFAFLISFALAGADELYQYTNAGRTGCIQDVLIDVLGACVGIAIYNLFRKKA